MDTDGVIQLFSLLILVFLSAFFSSAETAFSTVNRVRMRTLEEEGIKRAAKVNRILESYSKMLSTVLIGNNIVNLSTSALTTTIALRFGIPVAVATGVLTLVILLVVKVSKRRQAQRGETFRQSRERTGGSFFKRKKKDEPKNPDDKQKKD